MGDQYCMRWWTGQVYLLDGLDRDISGSDWVGAQQIDQSVVGAAKGCVNAGIASGLSPIELNGNTRSPADNVNMTWWRRCTCRE